MSPLSQMLPMLRGLRKQLRRAPHGAREALWAKWRKQLHMCFVNGLLTEQGHAWLSLRENVFAKRWGLPLQHGSTVYFGNGYAWAGPKPRPSRRQKRFTFRSRYDR